MAAPMGFLSEVVGKVSFVNKWPLLLKATQDDDVPTPGYLYKEITALTFESGNSCQCLVDFLVERLEKNSCHVKFKCLKIMVHLVERGHAAFSTALRRKAQGIQAATKYSGPPHTLHGMAPYVAVRKIAKELSEMLFDTEHASRQASGHFRKIPGRLHTQEGSKQLEGFGNTPISSQKPVTVETLGDSVKEGLQNLATRLSGENRSTLTPSHNETGYRPLHGCSSSSNPAYHHGLKEVHSSPTIPWSSSNVRPGHYSAVQMGEEEEEEEKEGEKVKGGDDTRQTVGSIMVMELTHGNQDRQGEIIADMNDGKGSPSSASLSFTGMPAPEGARGSGSKASDQHSWGSLDLSERLATVSSPDWSEETSAVDAFVASQNSRPAPTKEELQQFVKRSSSLNCHKMLELLASHPQPSTDTQLRCLFGMEGIIKEDLVSSDVALTLLSSHLRSLHSSQDRAVRSKAMKILRQLERLEADTNLDQPLTSDSRLLAQKTSDALRMSQTSPSGNTILGMELRDVPPTAEKQLEGAAPMAGIGVRDLSWNRDPGIKLGNTAPMSAMSALDCLSSNIHTSKPSIPSGNSNPTVVSVVERKTSVLFSGMNLVEGSKSSNKSTSLHTNHKQEGINKSSSSFVESRELLTEPDVDRVAKSGYNLTSPAIDLLMDNKPDLASKPDLLMDRHLSTHQGVSRTGCGIGTVYVNQTPPMVTASGSSGLGNVGLTSDQPTDDPQRHTHTDPIMSRGAGLSDLLQSLSLGSSTESERMNPSTTVASSGYGGKESCVFGSQPSASVLCERTVEQCSTTSTQIGIGRGQVSLTTSHNEGMTSQNITAIPPPQPPSAMTSQFNANSIKQPASAMTPHGAPTTKQPGMTSQEIARLFPQLSKAAFSGTSAIPLNLTAKPTGNFGFVSNAEDEKQNSSTVPTDAFSFIQDAMKGCKK